MYIWTETFMNDAFNFLILFEYSVKFQRYIDVNEILVYHNIEYHIKIFRIVKKKIGCFSNIIRLMSTT